MSSAFWFGFLRVVRTLQQNQALLFLQPSKICLSLCNVLYNAYKAHALLLLSSGRYLERGAFLFFLFLFLFLFVGGRYYHSGDGLGWSCFGLSTERASKRESRPRTPSAREWKVVGVSVVTTSTTREREELWCCVKSGFRGRSWCISVCGTGLSGITSLRREKEKERKRERDCG